MNETLTLGAVGPDVQKLQQMLIEEGYSVDQDAVSGVFSKATLSAVVLFQNGHLGPDATPLKPDGVVGSKTWWALNNPTGAVQNQMVNTAIVQPASNPIAAAAMVAGIREWQSNVMEEPNGSNRGKRIDVYTGMTGKDLSIKGPQWCGYFVSWCFAQAPGGSPFGRNGGAQSIAYWGQKHGCTTMHPYTCHPGDIFVIARDELHGHTGIVVAEQHGKIWTVEGNSGNAVRRLQRNLVDCFAVVNFDAWCAQRQIKGGNT